MTEQQIYQGTRFTFSKWKVWTHLGIIRKKDILEEALKNKIVLFRQYKDKELPLEIEKFNYETNDWEELK